MSQLSSVHITVDALGLMCPLPVLKLRKALKSCKNGCVVKLMADDPAAQIDVGHFCNETGNILLREEVEKNNIIGKIQSVEIKPLRVFYIKKKE